ncbi:MAG: hypothetical protein IJ299_01060 [Oscillospiraceae bacterium]|nr:hypothetical protein [Oscillospiraceae bacterium]
MNAITVKHENRTILITKDYAKKSSNPKSKEGMELMDFKKAYQDYSVVVRASRKRKSKISKITLANMEAYISKHDPTGSIMEAFENIVKESDNSIEYSGFFGVKKWFFEHYPDLKSIA